MALIRDIAFLNLLGLPLVAWTGILVFLLVFATALMPILNQKKLARIPVKYHIWLARISIGFALVHGLLAASGYLGF